MQPSRKEKDMQNKTKTLIPDEELIKRKRRKQVRNWIILIAVVLAIIGIVNLVGYLTRTSTVTTLPFSALETDKAIPSLRLRCPSNLSSCFCPDDRLCISIAACKCPSTRLA